MYPNLEAELKRFRLKRSDVAEVLGVHMVSVSRKLSGDNPISIKEAVTIRDALFPGASLDYLFSYSPEDGHDKS